MKSPAMDSLALLKPPQRRRRRSSPGRCHRRRCMQFDNGLGRRARALTLVPAGTAFTWRTSSPIAFAHVYVRPQQLDDVRFAEDRSVGSQTFLQAIEPAAEPRTLLLESLLESFLIRLAQKHASRGRGEDARMAALAPHRLQKVLDFLEANLDQDVSLVDLVSAAGTSQFHFSLAFHIAAGVPPTGTF